MSSSTRRAFLEGAVSLAAPKRPPNFLFVLLDDMGWTDLHCYGSDFYQTPNIDRLAADGMRFTNGYAACPVCSPSRAAILTGKTPARLHLTDWIPGRKQWPTARLLTPEFLQQLPLEETTIAEALKPAGYASASMGKWHLGGPPYYPDKQGFDLNVAGTFRGHTSHYFGPFPELPDMEGYTRNDYVTDCLLEKAEKFIGENRERPFFLYLAEFAVHLPLQAQAPLIEKYKARLRPGLRHHNPVYAAMIESVDGSVGRLRKRLAELGIADRTVVIYTSDNGGVIYEGRSKNPVTSNLPLRAGKGHVYEGGIRVPLIVDWPGVTKPGSVCETPACGIDVFPTLLEMAGLPAPRKGAVDGTSIVPLLKRKHFRREALYWHYPHYSNQGGVPAGAVRAGHYKLIEFYEDGRLELYDLSEDPGERRNLVRILPAKAAELHAMLRRWRASAHASMPTQNPRYDPATAAQGLTGAEAATPPM